MSRLPAGRGREETNFSFYNGPRRHGPNVDAPPARMLPARPSSPSSHQGRPRRGRYNGSMTQAAPRHKRSIPPNRSVTPTGSQPIAEVAKSRPWASTQASASVRSSLPSQIQEAAKASEATSTNPGNPSVRKRQRICEMAEEKGEENQNINVAAAYSSFLQFVWFLIATDSLLTHGRALDNWLEMVLKQKQARQQFEFHSKFEKAVPTNPRFLAIIDAVKEANSKVDEAQAVVMKACQEIASLTLKSVAPKLLVEVQRIQEIREAPVEVSSGTSVDAAKAAVEKEKEEQRASELEQLKIKISDLEGNKNAVQDLVERLKLLEAWREQEQGQKTADSAISPDYSDAAIPSEKPWLNVVSDAHTSNSVNKPPTTAVIEAQLASGPQLSDAAEPNAAPAPLSSRTSTETLVGFSRKAKLNAFINEIQRRIAAVEAAQAETRECFEDINNVLAMEREDKLIRRRLREKRKKDDALVEKSYIDTNQDESQSQVKEGPNIVVQGVFGQSGESTSGLPADMVPAKLAVALNPSQAPASPIPSQPVPSVPVESQPQPLPHSQPVLRNLNPSQEVSMSHVQTVPVTQLPPLAHQPSIPAQAAFTESTSSSTTTCQSPSSAPLVSFAASSATGSTSVLTTTSTRALTLESHVPSALSPYPPLSIPQPRQLTTKTRDTESNTTSVSSSTPTASPTHIVSAERIVPMFNDLVKFYTSLRVDLTVTQKSTAELVQGFAQITQEIQSLNYKTSPNYEHTLQTITANIREHGTKIEDLENVHSRFGRELHELTGIFEDFRLRFNNNFSVAESFSSSFRTSIGNHDVEIAGLKDAMRQVSMLCRDQHAPQIVELQKEHQHSQQLILSVRNHAFQLSTAIRDLADKVQELSSEIPTTIKAIVHDLATVTASCDALHKQLTSHEEMTRKMDNLSDMVEQAKQQWERRVNLREDESNGLRDSVEEMPQVLVDHSSEGSKTLPGILVNEDRFRRLENLVSRLQENLKRRDKEREQLITELSARDAKLTLLQQELIEMKMKMEENRKVGEEVNREIIMTCVKDAKEELVDKTKEDIKVYGFVPQ